MYHKKNRVTQQLLLSLKQRVYHRLLFHKSIELENQSVIKNPNKKNHSSNL
jgi:hypothetical protein